MFLLRRPSDERVARSFDWGATAPFNYDPGSATLEHPPPGYFQNDTRVVLGAGERCWRHANEALRGWQVTRLVWCDFLSQQDEPRRGQTLVARITHMGFWSLQMSRIIDVQHEPRHYSFTIRTLKGHDKQGEERFELEWRPNGEVRFRICSYSRPAHLAGWLGLPYVRHLQRRFGRDAARRIQTLA